MQDLASGACKAHTSKDQYARLFTRRTSVLHRDIATNPVEAGLSPCACVHEILSSFHFFWRGSWNSDLVRLVARHGLDIHSLHTKLLCKLVTGRISAEIALIGSCNGSSLRIPRISPPTGYFRQGEHHSCSEWRASAYRQV